ncbi:MAG: hypothetical protein WB798_11295 [Nocardioidaceae bacterium]
MLATVISGVLAATAVPSSTAAQPRKTSVQAGVFRVASFNVLGASHTPVGGRRASGATRIVWANQLLERHRVEVVGFQELQASQLSAFTSLTDGAWEVYPGLQRKRLDSENSIGWRTDRFDLVNATTVDIPYFNGSPRAMPLVLLRDKRSGMLTYVANYHNPADTSKYRNQQKWRDIATEIEIRLQNQLAGQNIPRIMTGDFNERASFFCRVTAGAPLHAARPTSYRRGGVCHAGSPRAVDWILGALRVQFSNYVEDRSELVDKTTDHPLIVATAKVDPAAMPQAWATETPAAVVPRHTWKR